MPKAMSHIDTKMLERVVNLAFKSPIFSSSKLKLLKI